MAKFDITTKTNNAIKFTMFNKHIKSLVKSLSKERQKLVVKHEDSYDATIGEFGDYNIPWPSKADELGTQIYDLLKKHYKSLPFDLVIEELTHLGAAPCLLYDDRGHFAISGDGYSSIGMDNEPSDINMSFHIEKHMWKKTIKEALEYFLNYED